jgi:hypothetical protein
MVFSGAKIQFRAFRESGVGRDNCHSTSCGYFNPLSSFVLHMMYYNCGNIRRPRRVGAQQACNLGLAVREMDDIVEVIAEWEEDGKPDSG